MEYSILQYNSEAVPSWVNFSSSSQNLTFSPIPLVESEAQYNFSIQVDHNGESFVKNYFVTVQP